MKEIPNNFTVKQLDNARAVLLKEHPHGVRVARTVDTLAGVNPITRQIIHHFERRGIRLLNQINPR